MCSLYVVRSLAVGVRLSVTDSGRGPETVTAETVTAETVTPGQPPAMMSHVYKMQCRKLAVDGPRPMGSISENSTQRRQKTLGQSGSSRASSQSGSRAIS